MFRTLIVDDDPDVLELARHSLENCALACDTAIDGEEALAMFNRAPYDAVVTDLRMPRMHGHALVMQLESQPSPPFVVVMSGLQDQRLVCDLVARGVDDVLIKPLNFDMLALRLLVQAKKAQMVSEPALNASPSDFDRQSLLRTIEKSLVELSGIFAEPLEGVFDRCDELTDPPQGVNDFIGRVSRLEEAAEALAANQALSENRVYETVREHQRVQCAAKVTAVPVTNRFAVCGDPVRLTLRDLSRGGAKILHTRAVSDSYLALQWAAETLPGEDIQIVAKVARCEPLSPFYDIGCRFLESA